MIKIRKFLTKEEIKEKFFEVRKNYYLNLLKLFVATDIFDYEIYEHELYFSLRFLDYLKGENKFLKKSFVKNELLHCCEFYYDEIIENSINLYNEKIHEMFDNTDAKNCVDEIDKNKFSKDEFVNFFCAYTNWLVEILCKHDDEKYCDELNFFKLNKKVDKLLKWDIKKTVKKSTMKNNFFVNDDELFNVNNSNKNNLIYNYNLTYDFDCSFLFQDLGERFLKIFHKIYLKKNNSKIEIDEMQFLFDYVKKIKVGKNQERLLDFEIRSDFLNASSFSPDEIVDMTRFELVKYDKFCTCLLYCESVSKALKCVEI